MNTIRDASTLAGVILDGVLGRHGIEISHVVHHNLSLVLDDGRVFVRGDLDVIGAHPDGRLLPGVSSESVPVTCIQINEPMPPSEG